MNEKPTPSPDTARTAAAEADNRKREQTAEADEQMRPEGAEIAGPQGPEPTRYGDWERKGRCIDF